MPYPRSDSHSAISAVPHWSVTGRHQPASGATGTFQTADRLTKLRTLTDNRRPGYINFKWDTIGHYTPRAHRQIVKSTMVSGLRLPDNCAIAGTADRVELHLYLLGEHPKRCDAAALSADSDEPGTDRDVNNVIEPAHGRGVHVLRSGGKLYLGAGAGDTARSIRLASRQ